jgi:hypothetical protein
MSDTDTPTVRPFSCGSQGSDWMSANCERCQKGGESAGACDIDVAHGKAYWGDGKVPQAIADRMGATEFGHGRCYNWPCPEFRDVTTGEPHDIDEFRSRKGLKP